MSLPQAGDARPPFMVALGLLPPYSESDVKQAYRERVKAAHPDLGGSPQAFQEVRTAYELALHYLQLRSNRRAWLASQVEAYTRLENLAESLSRRYSAEVAWEEKPGWLEHSFGDFALLLNRITSIRLENSPLAERMIDELVPHQKELQQLQHLELAGSRVPDAAALKLAAFPSLTYLDLRKTPVTSRIAALVEGLPNLRTLMLKGSSVGWWTRWRIGLAIRRRQRPGKARFAPGQSSPRPFASTR